MSAEDVVGEDRYADVELDYTEFGSAEAFRQLLNRHRLGQCGTVRRQVDIPPGAAEFSMGNWQIWDGDHVCLYTACNPLDSEGFGSCVTLHGQRPQVEQLYKDLVQTAVHIKGGAAPLTRLDGTVVSQPSGRSA